MSDLILPGDPKFSVPSETKFNIEVDDKFLDVFFPDQDQFVFGAIPESGFGDELMGDFEDVEEVLTEKQMREYIERMDSGDLLGGEWFATRNFDQSQEGSCVYNATGQALESNQCRTVGADNVIPLSAISGYQLAARSASSGMMVSDGARIAMDIGTLPLDTPENRAQFGDQVMANTGFKQKRPDNWKPTASLFRAKEVLRIRSLPGLLTAALKFGAVVGREGHSIYYARPMWLGRGFGFGYWNSWLRWGKAAGRLPWGFGVDSVNQVKKSASYAFAIRTMNVVHRKAA